MISNLFFEISGIIFTLFLFNIYYSKKRLISVSNNIYIKLMISNFVVLLFDILSVFFVLNDGTNSIISILLSKLYFVSIIVWLFILTAYIFVISFKKVDRLPKNEKTSSTRIIKRVIPLCFLSILSVLVLPLKIVHSNNTIYFNGLSSYLLYGIVALCIISWIVNYVSKFRYIKRSKSNTVLFVIIVMLICTSIQILYPQFLMLTLSIYFITFALYFYIDNPDLNLLNELENTKKEALEAETSKADALLKASHEIRTPLNAIVGFSQSIMEGSSNNIKEDVMHIKTSSEALVDIVNNILEISNVDMQKYKLIYNDYNVSMLVKQIEGLAKSKLEDKKIELEVNIEENVPKYLCGDSIRIKQIILGVLYNAIKYTKVGEITFNVGCITIGNICRLIITIKDTGIGIYEDKLETIFAGKIIDNQELTADDINVNLPTIKDMLKSMNGQITIESEYREGTTVTLVIAQKLGANKEEEATEKRNVMRDFTSKKVLIVDDDKINLKVASRLLSSYKVIVDEVNDGFDCIAKIQNREHYDLIFLDDWMPKISGVETLKKLDEIEGFNTPVVALTANATPEMRDKYIKDGFNDYIPKPIERKELDRVIDKYLNE